VTEYVVIESGTGDELGTLRVRDDLPDEAVLESLVTAGYLDPPADAYEIDDAYPFTDEGQRTVIDGEGEPVLVLDSEPPEYDDDEDNDDDDDDEPLNGDDT
jgi:hypothetical protein